MKQLLWIAAIAIGAFTACNYTDGPCYLREGGDGYEGAGGGVIVPGWGGGYGDVPPEPQNATDPPLECNAIGGYSASLFKFTTTVPDDGKGKAGGYQEATATVKFVDGRQVVPAAWSCTLNVGMAVRSASSGNISPEYAAEITAGVLTAASSITMHSRPSWLKALFCSKLQENMLTIFGQQHAGVGARVTAQ